MKKLYPILERSIAFAFCILFLTPICSFGVLIGPGPLPDWHNESQVQLGWAFADPTDPQDTDIVDTEEWGKRYIGDTRPSWDYDSSRTAWDKPAQWYIRIPNLVNDNPIKNFWISWVYEFDTYQTAEFRSATNIDWFPDYYVYDNFIYDEVWFTSTGALTDDYKLAYYAQVTVSLDLKPSPEYEDVYLGVFDGPGSPKYATEVYIKTRSVVPIPPAIYLMGSGLVGLIGIKRRMSKGNRR